MEKETNALIRWGVFDEGANHDAKRSYLTSFATRPKVSSMFERLYRHWIDPLSMIFDQGYTAYDTALRLENVPSPAETETQFGKVTYEGLWAILKKDLPEPSA